MKSPWYPRYPQDLIGSIDCRMMTLEQYGLFNWLLDYLWANESMPGYLESDAVGLAKLVGVPLKKFVSVYAPIQKKFRLWIDPRTQKEYIYNPRLLEEYHKRLAQSERQENKARAAAIIRWGSHAPSNAPSMPQAMLEDASKQCLTDSPLQSQSEGTPIVPFSGDENLSEYTDAFEQFWKQYPKKKGKDAAFKAWKKRRFTQHTQEIVLEAIARAKQSADWLKSSGKFIPHPATWLNAGGWNDETVPLASKAATGMVL